MKTQKKGTESNPINMLMVKGALSAMDAEPQKESKKAVFINVMNILMLLKEIIIQLTSFPKECFRAFFCYMPSAHGVTPKAGFTTTQRPEKISFNEVFEHIKSQTDKL